jgi:hypothetical protein
MTILNEYKEVFNECDPKGVPTYVYDGSIEEYKRLRAEGKLFLNQNVFMIDRKSVIKG